MSGVARVMFSPSSSITTRSTPCVDGCCGPMLRVIRCLPISSGVGCASSMPTLVLSSCMAFLFVLVAVLVAVHRIVLAQWMAFPIGRHHDAAQVGVIAETDSEHVESFALVPVRAAPDARYGVDFVVLSDTALQANTQIAGDRVQQV